MKKVFQFCCILIFVFCLVFSLIACNDKSSSCSHKMKKSKFLDATCTIEGNVEYYTCLLCNKIFADSNGKTEISKEETVILPKHNFSGNQCTECDYFFTLGLAYEFNEDDCSYTVTGIGSATDTDIIIPEVYENFPVCAIKESAFENSSFITSIDIPNTVEFIGGRSFYSCENLESITIGTNVKTIGNSAFSNCIKLSKINFNAVQTQEFEGSSSSLFYDAGKSGNGIKVFIGNKVKRIPANLFYPYHTNSPKVVSLEFEEGSVCESIGENAFADCTELSSVTLPDTLVAIEGCAFMRTGIVNLNFSEKLTSVAENAFDGCYDIENITVDENNSVYKSIDGCLYNKSGKTFILYPASKPGESFTIPDGVQIISESAFSASKNLNSITVPIGVTSIEEYAFSYCDNLTALFLPEGLISIGNNAFERSLILKNIDIPTTVTSIGKSAFYGCEALESITLPSGVTVVEESTFCGCYNLGSVALSENTIKIKENAFFNCNLLSITIFKNVSYIGYSAFDGCDNLIIYCEAENQPSGWDENWNVSRRPIVWDCDNNDVAADGYIYYETDGICYSLNDDVASVVATSQSNDVIIIPSYITYGEKNYAVTFISSSAFVSNTYIISITIPKSVTGISYEALQGLHSSVTVYCEADYKDTLYNNLDSYDFAVVWNYKQNNVASDGYVYEIIDGIRYALKNSEAFVARQPFEIIVADIPSTVTYQNCEYTVTAIGEEAFDGSKIANISLPSTIVKIGKEAFHSCYYLKSIAIPDSVKTIEEYAFSGCHAMTSITLGNGLTQIKASAFWANGFKNIILPESLKEIGDGAFTFSKLTSITVPNGVTYIGIGAFSSCEDLISAHIGSGVKKMGSAPFNGCFNISEITIDEKNTAYKIENGAIYTKNGDTLVQYILGREDTTFVVPNTVTQIGDWAFNSADNLINITIPNSVLKIGRNVFSNCDNLSYTKYENAYYLGNEENPCLVLVKALNSNISTCTIHAQTRFIHDHAFDDCDQLKSIVIPDSVLSIGEYAFASCENLNTVTIGSSVNSIGAAAFTQAYHIVNKMTFNDVSCWYRTQEYSDWENKTDGTAINVEDPYYNGEYFKTSYNSEDWYFYKK